MGPSSDVRSNGRSVATVALPAMFQRYQEGLEEELRLALGEKPPLLYSMLQYHMGWVDEQGRPLTPPASRGKALRPVLCLFTSHILGGDWATALPAAAALELIHNFSLIHDDIQDADVERRHRPTVWFLWGQPQALVAGNGMRTLADMATLRLVERGFPPEKVLSISRGLTEGYLEMIQGQCLDLSFERRLDITLPDYLSMISLKTGALIRCSAELGAFLATDDGATAQAFARMGALLGLVFQIRDDVLGIWGDEGTTGKAVGGDIMRKKKSFPIVFALERADPRARKALQQVYGKSAVTQGDLEQVLAVLEELGAQAYAHQLIVEKSGLALKEVEDTPLPAWARHELQELVEFLGSRPY